VRDGDADGPAAAYPVLLLIVVLVGVFDGLSQGAVFGDAATLPAEYTHVRFVCVGP